MSLRDEVENIISALEITSSEEDIENGWNQSLRAKWKQWYIELDKKITNGDRLPSPMSAARAMDFDGVGRTKISYMAGHIDERINEGERY